MIITRFFSNIHWWFKIISSNFRAESFPKRALNENLRHWFFPNFFLVLFLYGGDMFLSNLSLLFWGILFFCSNYTLQKTGIVFLVLTKFLYNLSIIQGGLVFLFPLTVFKIGIICFHLFTLCSKLYKCNLNFRAPLS